MEFKTLLNDYIDKMDISGKELSNASGISETVISRYRNGDRIPKYNSKQLNYLIIGLSKIAKDKNINEESIKNDFNNLYNDINIDIFRNNLNLLINTLKINVADLAKYLGFDASYISKIKNGERIPKNIDEFVSGICKYINENFRSDSDIQEIQSLIGFTINNDYYDELVKWISNNNQNDTKIDSFLIKLDDFDLNNYIKSINFDKLKVPNIPIEIHKSKTYYGLQGFKDSQLDVLKGIVLSKSKEDIYFYSNMPMIEASKDIDFTKKFMFGIAMALKKGQHINMIHDLDRPFNELMLGLEGWIPLYMTGLISPYYFKENFNTLYNTIDITSGTYALSGRCINGNINKSKYYLTNKKDEIDYYKENSKNLIKKANSLMDIYNCQRKIEYTKFLNNINNNIKNIYYNLPIYAISNKLLNKILDKNNISNEDKNSIRKFVDNEKKRINKLLENNTIIDEINKVNKKDFNLNLSLSNMFNDNKISYDYEDYLEYIESLKDFKANHKNYNFKFKENIFKNINISIIDKELFIISKENMPSIHFVIHHPLLVKAISNFKVSIKD